MLTRNVPFHHAPVWLYPIAARYFMTGFSDLLSPALVFAIAAALVALVAGLVMMGGLL